MKAAIYPGAGKPIVIETLPDPTPAPGEILIRVDRCGICGTDLSMTRGEAWDYGNNVQFGHEYAGEIVGLGKGVERLRLGQKIAVLPSGACGHCAGCDGGNHVMCRAPGATAGFSELAVLPASLAIPLPDTLSLADGALVEPLAVSLYGIRQSRMQPGARVVVLGGGTVALYAIYWARRMGASKIVAMSRSDRRKDKCLAMGADAFIAFSDNEAAHVAEALGGAPDVVYEAVGAPGMLSKAIGLAKVYGTVTSLGFCMKPDQISPAMAAYKCVTVQFLVGYTMQEFLYIADQMDKGHVDPKTIVTNTIALPDLPAMFDTLRDANTETKVHVRHG